MTNPLKPNALFTIATVIVAGLVMTWWLRFTVVVQGPMVYRLDRWTGHLDVMRHGPEVIKWERVQ